MPKENEPKTEQAPEPSIGDVLAALTALSDKVEATEKKTDELVTINERTNKRADKAEELARKHQTNYDTLLAARNQTAQRGLPVTPAQRQLQEVDNEAMQNTLRENEFLKELARRGLTREQVEESISLDSLQTPVELRLALDNYETKQQLSKLQEQLSSNQEKSPKGEGEPTPPSSEGKIDTGGQSGEGAGDQASQQAHALEEKYKQARSKGKTVEARWKLLEAIHQDPSKLIPKSSKE